MSFAPTPNYAMLAEAATGEGIGSEANQWMKGTRVQTVREFEAALAVAKERVIKSRQGTIIEIVM